MYTDLTLSDRKKLRVISAKSAAVESTWHRDAEDRTVTILDSTNWWFQREDSLPVLLKAGDVVKITAREWHRVIPGEGDLKILIEYS